MSVHKKVALLWLFIVSLLIIYNVYLFADKHVSFNSDILALLPAEQRDPVVQKASDHMLDTVQQQLAILVGGKTWADASQAADKYIAIINTRPDLIESIKYNQSDWLSTFEKSQLNLLTAQQHINLQTQPAQYWVDVALGNLYTPFAGMKIGAWQDDPFGLFSGWVQERAQETPVRPRDGKLFVADNDHNYVVLLLHLKKPAFSMETQKVLIPLLDNAKAAVPDAEVMTAGTVLHAVFGREQASHEMSTIAVGSLLGIVLLLWLSFRSLKPILFIGLSIGIGCLGALSICELVLGQINLLTLVFGASLLGVAQDYGIYFLCSGQSLKKLWPGLILTLLAAIIGYMGLALTPFPGLQQMALFSGVGLLFAWLTVICWFLVLVNPENLKPSYLAIQFNKMLNDWPVLNKKFIFLMIIIVVIGFSKLTISDDVRSLQKPPQVLLNDQLKLSQLLDAPTLVQFYLIQGPTKESVLQREESLKLKLNDLVNQKIISGYQAMSNWVPSVQQQIKNQKLIQQKLLYTPLENVADKIGENKAWVDNIRNHLLHSTMLLTPSTFLTMPASQPWRFLWLGKIDNNYASIVAIKGLANYAHLPQLQKIASNSNGVQWVDKISEISDVLKHCREYMSAVVMGAYVTIYLLLYLRYRIRAWRILISPALSSLLVIGLLGICGVPLQLFHVLALLLILGLGVDYGIFLQEKSNHAWLTIGLSAMSALLSFGLLALSKTPPLHAFGLTMLVGMTIVWLISPCFRTPDGERCETH